MEILSLGEKIKRKRKELNMTLKDLAKDRITPGQISLVESGRSNPSMDLLEYLANNLNTTVEYLMESEESQAEKVCTYYEQIAEAYILDEGYLVAEKYIENALYYAELYNLENKKAKILYLRAKIHVGKGEITLAQQYFLSANVIFIKNSKHRDIIQTFLNLAKITLELKAYYSANSYLKQAEKVYIDNEIGEDYLLGEIYFYLAKTYFEMDNIGQAIDYSFLAKEKFEKINNKDKYAKTLLFLSEEYSKKGDLENAIKYSKKTLKIYKELNDINNISNIENDLGKLFYNFENIEESFKHYELARDIRMQNNDDKVIDTLINISKNYLKIKDLNKCVEILDDIEDRLTENNKDEMIECNLVRYRMAIINGRDIEAEQILLDSYKFAKSNELYQRAGELAIMIGKFYLDNKNDENAAKYLDEGVSIFREIGILNN
ncbi:MULTISPECIES: helix-turn-helix domain-containing protein [Clostridium]|uniref:Helix-turn-helix transcriptional regulator n=1 Tax=Clostridium nitritogenes TaxID=83340 RepID=A0ABP3X1F5_9CLOT|nr:helix-turn-helix transcriptional regulator [Clostridium baratii]KJU70468.1 XRE family transcriptional regulator [Clostridium baratii]MBT9831145.1 helix-turn-helix domain-containing protein [Clostridium baratii]MDY3206331.1 helix-turn-helix transcriptional regulator [Clostridium baratii]STB00478.1 TPR repeat-containing DNA binding protein [Clostridium baratii]